MVQVKVTEGILEGKVEENSYGSDFYSFKGIPYAEPPVGDLRFKAPIPKQPWEGLREAKSCGPNSVQVNFLKPDEGIIGSEDCLYLNVYTPEINPSKALPVMFWIHGGGFFFGHGDDKTFSPRFLVKEGVILVTINYRLDALGFLCLDTEDIPGNAGLKDQVAALKWVNKNISYFGGDPDNITIFGESAGGMSVSNLMVSPLTKGLYKRVIAQSGTCLTPGAYMTHARERGLALARQLGCQSNDNKEIYQFLKSIPAKDLTGHHINLTFLEDNRKTIDVYFGPVIEKEFDNIEAFLIEDACESLRAKHDAPEILLGYTEHEGGLMLLTDSDFKNITARFNTFRELLVPKILVPSTTIDKQFEIAARVKEFYFNKENVEMQNLIKLLDFFTFDMFGFATAEWAKLCASKTDSKVYLYKFTIKTERNQTMEFNPVVQEVLGIKLTNHGDDVGYLFPSPLDGTRKIEESTYKCIDNVVKMWTNFAKYGNPTPDDSLGVNWKPYLPNKKNYLDIGNQLSTGVNIDEDVFQFWEKLIRLFGSHDQKKRFGLLE